MSINIKLLRPSDVALWLPSLAHLLVNGVRSGASISFIEPFDVSQAASFWQDKVLPEVQSGETLLWVALEGDRVIGTVQLIVGLAPNQAHRCEVAKMIVHTEFRRQGVGRKLMDKVLDKARTLGKQLITLDTRSGDVSMQLYRSVGFEVAGEIPDFALDPDGSKFSGTTYMYQKL